VAKLNASIGYTSNAAAKQDGVNAPPALEASALELEWVYMTLRSGKRKHAPTTAKEAVEGDPPSPVEEPPQGLSEDDEMEVEEADDDEDVVALAAAPSALEASMADFDPDYSETESDVVTEAGSDADAGWVTGNGPAMYMFDYFDDFVRHYRIYSPTDAMWHAWNAAQDFDVDEFEEVAPDENNDDVE